MKKRHYLFGYFKGTSQTPEYDPGLEVPCIFCQKKLSKPIKTISLISMDTHKRDRSFFYRCHKECYEKLSPNEIALYESALIDNL